MISIVIPTYLQPKYGSGMLIVLLNSIMMQKTSIEFEVCISDNDDTGEIERICSYFSFFPLSYKRNPVKGASENFNSAIDMAAYDNIKLMCMDDAFHTTNAIDQYAMLLKKYNWVIGNSVHINEDGKVYGRRVTKYNHNQMETNITGMPSVVAFKKCDIRFDPRIKTFCDTFFYYQLYEKYGQPGIISDFTIACRFWGGSLSHNQPNHKKADLELLRKEKLIKC